MYIIEHKFVKLEGEEDDLVEDTPIQSSSYRGCPDYPQFSCGQLSMTTNFMNEVDDACMHFFTKGQTERMMASLQLFRSGLLDNQNCTENNSSITKPQVEVLPNPAKEWLVIRAKGFGSTEITVLIYDVAGKLRTEYKSPVDRYSTFNIAHLRSGMYIIKCIGEKTGQCFTSTLVVQ